MQIIIYKCADNSLFIDKIEEREGDGFVLSFPEGIRGKCHFGKHILPITLGKCRIGVPLTRQAYPLWIEGEQRRFEGEGLVYRDGKLHRAIPAEFSEIHYEIASLKAQLTTLSTQVKALSDTVFRTVIF